MRLGSALVGAEPGPATKQNEVRGKAREWTYVVVMIDSLTLQQAMAGWVSSDASH